MIRYLSFNSPKNTEGNHQPSFADKFLQPVLEKFFTLILPVANPDFEKKIEEVAVWLVEFEDDIPNREIGINALGEVIVAMPWNDNYGYWTDNNMLLEHFENHFDVCEVSGEEFDAIWNKFTAA